MSLDGHHSMAAFAIALAVVVSTRPLAGQQDTSSRVSGVVRGTVVDPMGAALEGAEVSIRPSGSPVQTASDGSFILRGAPRGRFAVAVRRVGYFPLVLEMDLTDRSLWVGRIVMTPGAYRLPEVEVAARNTKPAEYSFTTKYDDFFRRKRLGLGSFVSREDIERRGATRTAELLQMIPGARISIQPPGMPTRVAFARCDERPPKISVWINGQRLIPEGGDPAPGGSGRSDARSAGLVGEMLDRIGPSQIEMIEVYRGVSQIPGEFSSNACAAIVIWTR